MEPLDIAQIFLQSRTPRNGLRYWRGDFYQFEVERGLYLKINEDEFEAEVGQFLHELSMTADFSDGPYLNSSYRRAETLRALQWLTIVKTSTTPPCWVQDPPQGQQVGERCTSYIPLKNGILDVEAWGRGEVSLLEKTSTYFCTTALDLPFVRDARCPRFDKFLADFTAGDGELANMIQEWAGLCLVPDNRYQKFSVFVGNGANGKSVLAAVLRRLVGEDNCSTRSLRQFGGQFGYQPLVGKLLNISDELSEADKAYEDRLKTVVGGSPVSIDQKYRDAYDTVLWVRLMFVTNVLPHFADRSDGLWRRLLLFPCRQTVSEGEQDRELCEKLFAEMPGVLNWALEGLRRLRSQGHFSVAKVSEAAAKEYRLECNPLSEFISDVLGLVPAGIKVETPTFPSILRAFEVWAPAHGIRQTYSAKSFGQELRRHFPNVDVRQRGRGEKRVRVYGGIGFLADIEAAAGWQQAAG